MNLQVGSDEVLSAIKSVRDTTQNQRVRRVMQRALELYGGQQQATQSVDSGLSVAATVLLEEMAKTKRLERTILWLGPVVALAVTVVMFAALRTLWLGL